MLSRTSRAASGVPVRITIRSRSTGSAVGAASSVTVTEITGRPTYAARGSAPRSASCPAADSGLQRHHAREQEQPPRGVPHQNACLTRISSA